jgi:serine/threonine protein kinase
LEGDIPWPNEGVLSKEVVDLIKKLLVFEPEDRLTIPQIKKHPFYKSIDWDKLYIEEACYVPPKTDELDTSNFDERHGLYPVENDPSLNQDVIDATSPLPHSDSFSTVSVDALKQINLNQLNKKK